MDKYPAGFKEGLLIPNKAEVIYRGFYLLILWIKFSNIHVEKKA